MSWFRVSGGRLEYRGRIVRGPFTAWTASGDGARAMDEAAREIRFAVFGRVAKARRRTWRALDRAARSEPLLTMLRAEADRYMALMAALAYLPLLPSARVSLQRLVVVPRATLSGRARDALVSRLRDSPGLAQVGEAVRAFFLTRLVREMDNAILAAAPSLRHPIHAGDEWACVGADRKMQWMDPIWSGPDWGGHLFMYEFPRRQLARKERREIEKTLEGIATELATLSHLQRHNLLRAALDSGLTLRNV